MTRFVRASPPEAQYRRNGHASRFAGVSGLPPPNPFGSRTQSPPATRQPDRGSRSIVAAVTVATTFGRRSLPLSFLAGAGIGILGGMIGLGGAEFRLPLLIGVFGFIALQAVILNKASLIGKSP